MTHIISWDTFLIATGHGATPYAIATEICLRDKSCVKRLKPAITDGTEVWVVESLDEANLRTLEGASGLTHVDSEEAVRLHFLAQRNELRAAPKSQKNAKLILEMLLGQLDGHHVVSQAQVVELIRSAVAVL